MIGYAPPGGPFLPRHAVNLDALIRREDFEVAIDPKKIEAFDEATKLKVVEIEKDNLMFRWLRKPDFQRTTAHWKPEKVAAFIKSFLSGDLIPALILWRSNASGSIFVIDGAHRLSALIAWVHDDYGDGAISQVFFEGNMPPEQKSAAKETRNLVADTIGSYSQIKAWSGGGSEEKDRYASNLAAGGVTLQWVRGDASRAERSFHTINTEQTPIGDLEVRLIRDRRCPNVMATRALIQAGTGQYSTSSLPAPAKEQIKKLASDVYGDLFMPPLEDPIKTLDLPVAGRSYSSDSVKLILDLVEFLNGESDPKILRKKKGADILSPTIAQDVHVPPEQSDGTVTIEFLKKVRKASSRIAGPQSQSLGLHPAVYFYSATGSYQPTAFLAATSFVMDLEANKELVKFVRVRREFEDLILKHKYFINQIVAHYGSGHRSLGALTKLFRYFFDGVTSGVTVQPCKSRVTEIFKNLQFRPGS
jgi:hypothetical protein